MLEQILLLNSSLRSWACAQEIAFLLIVDASTDTELISAKTVSSEATHRRVSFARRSRRRRRGTARRAFIFLRREHIFLCRLYSTRLNLMQLGDVDGRRFFAFAINCRNVHLVLQCGWNRFAWYLPSFLCIAKASEDTSNTSKQSDIETEAKNSVLHGMSAAPVR
jgi:hypothetical protein